MRMTFTASPATRAPISQLAFDSTLRTAAWRDCGWPRVAGMG